MLWLLLEVNELLEGHVSSEARQDLFLGSLESAWSDDCDHLLHLDERLMIILSHLLNLLD